MNEPLQILGDPKQGLRDILARIIRDFDSKSGAFAGLKYNSPWILATQDWAERSGHTVEELCEMISQWRISIFSGEQAGPGIVQVFEDVRSAAEEWRTETGYVDPPLPHDPEEAKFPNRKELKAHTLKAWDSLGLSTQWHHYDARDLSFSGIFEDRFGHNVRLSMTFKLAYGGPIRLFFQFPYYSEGDPRHLDLFILSGGFVRQDLRLPESPDLKWIVGKSRTNFDTIDGVLAIVRAILSYLRPTLQ
ncbi:MULTISPECIES: hypothetical protein [unclassified Mesorhizobium]|uniref:hypothetical protein n=1 Tax=unclassified Mesorhizobium TaxID=325217 RepID=UPI000BB01288|nr:MULTISPECIES: hypothetical protein [unclassified Mesorhizobium]PBB25875.1 hypothetical protein CK232_16435 [Mesorhizobium sp. WSM4304]PBB73410.1 hypothetical protein CK227_20780 [Mesorhizobium sp. WSM4308]PBC24646.1 hypothetical protein CK226_01920 [Mesorhizobium sp. WSM4311]TRD09464.1 hypothetical protein FJV82_01920 [Mesorhizobium sp. WSM4305]